MNNDMKNVIISIKGLQTSEDGAAPIELVTGGKYSYGGDETMLSYMESELTGMDGTKTTFRVGKDSMTMTREGTVNAQMTFQKGRKHVFLYQTPQGTTTLGVDTNRLKLGLGESGGDMEFSYNIDVDNMLLGTNSYKINVREA